MTAVSNMLLKLAAVLCLLNCHYTFAFAPLLQSRIRDKNHDQPSSSLRLSAVSRLVAYYDGGEWQSLKDACRSDNDNLESLDEEKAGDDSLAGRVDFVIGTTKKGDKVVAIQASTTTTSDTNQTTQLDNNVAVYTDSIVKVPKSLSDATVFSIAYHAISLHCLLPPSPWKVENIGGDANTTFSTNATNVVAVLGGHPRAVQSARALQILGANVTLVTAGNTNNAQKKLSVMAYGGNNDKLTPINVISPVIENEVIKDAPAIGFAEHLLHFDAMLDTLEYEKPDTSVRKLLLQRHKCVRYQSLQSQAQRILAEEGILWGPGKIKEHADTVTVSTKTTMLDFEKLPPQLSGTIEKLLNYVADNKMRKPLFEPIQGNGKPFVHSWSRDEFWEATTWPLDSSGIATTRFGLPVIEDLTLLSSEFDEKKKKKRVVAEPPGIEKFYKDDEEKTEEEKEMIAQEQQSIFQVTGVIGMQTQIMDQELNCILFMSAGFCRTCRKIKPRYVQMARNADYSATKQHNHAVNASSSVHFAQADATGPIGKSLGRALGVDAVPAFVLFKDGEVYGRPLGVTRLPSAVLDYTLEALSQGKPWDEEKVKEIEELERPWKKSR